eukprot:gene1955-2283_t
MARDNLVIVLVCLALLLVSHHAAADRSGFHRKIRIGRALLQTFTRADLAVPVAESSLSFGTLSFKTAGGKVVQVELNPADPPQAPATSSNAATMQPIGSNSTAASAGNATALDSTAPSVAAAINATNSTSGTFNSSVSSIGTDTTSGLQTSPNNASTSSSNTSTGNISANHSAVSQSGPGSSSLLLLESGLLLASPHPGTPVPSPVQQQKVPDSPGNATVPHMNATSFESSGSSATYNSSVMSLVPVKHNYRLANTSQALDSVLGLPLEPVQTDSRMASWVVCAWSVSNFSSTTMLSEATRTSIQKMITQYFTGMAPGQVQLANTANLTVSYTFTGISGWNAAATRALRQLASDMAGGYNPAYISILYSRPNFGVPTQQFMEQSQQAVLHRQQEVVHPTSSGNSSNTTTNRKLLQDSGVGSSPPELSSLLEVWVMYSLMAPKNVTSLSDTLSSACGGMEMTAGADVTRMPCGLATEQALTAAGVTIQKAAYSQSITEQPMISLSVRLAVGVTGAQAAAGTDEALADWLSQPRNIRNAIAASGMPDPFGPDALVKWLQLPEIWVQRRRRHQGKRRYLAPQPPHLLASTSAAGGAGSSLAAEAAAAADEAAEDIDSNNDTILDPDQIRPHLKELGDSVTSAVRFEQDDENDDAEAAAHGDADATATAAVAAPVGAARILAARQALLAEQGVQLNGRGTASGSSGSHRGMAAGVAAADAAGGSQLLSASVDAGDRTGIYSSPRTSASMDAMQHSWGSSSGGRRISHPDGSASCFSSQQGKLLIESATSGPQGSSGQASGGSSPWPPTTPVPGSACNAGMMSLPPSPAFAVFGAVAGAPVTTASQRASPFAVAYNFQDLAECAPASCTLDCLGLTGSAATAGVRGMAAAVSSSPSASVNCRTRCGGCSNMHSTLSATHGSPGSMSLGDVGSTSFGGVGSTCIAVESTGGFIISEEQHSSSRGARLFLGSSPEWDYPCFLSTEWLPHFSNGIYAAMVFFKGDEEHAREVKGQEEMIVVGKGIEIFNKCQLHVEVHVVPVPLTQLLHLLRMKDEREF